MKIPSFYINNTASTDNQLKGLLHQFKKIVFQFLMDEKGSLTLVAYGAKEHNKKFGDPVNLKLSKQPALEIKTSVYWGNYEVGKSDEMDVLREAEKNPKGKEYIHIVPKKIKDGRIEFEVTASDNPSSLL
ncbi:MAG TPA: hypothetical protein VLZ28_09200, partial [Daejeonella sp.]|nr:hypothetical protein [Daejeonella sp.]